jgi:hypothetical protein
MLISEQIIHQIICFLPEGQVGPKNHKQIEISSLRILLNKDDKDLSIVWWEKEDPQL